MIKQLTIKPIQVKEITNQDILYYQFYMDNPEYITKDVMTEAMRNNTRAYTYLKLKHDEWLNRCRNQDRKRLKATERKHLYSLQVGLGNGYFRLAILVSWNGVVYENMTYNDY